MGNSIQGFKERINKKKARICVVGLGYVGLPLALEFAKKGFYVLGIDIDKDRLAHISKKESYISDIPTAELRKIIASGKFRASANFQALKGADAVIICVPTPLKRKYHPDISYIKQAVNSIAKNIKKGSLIILESTTYPGTTEDVILPLLESKGLKCGEDFYLAFSPERIDPGNAKYPVNKIPKVVGGITKEATDLTVALYKNIIHKVVPVSSSRVAEAVKLLENTFRLINIGLIDELAMMAHKMGIDIWEVIEAAKTKPFGFMPFYPGPGVGGHCIPKDPLYLYWKAGLQGFKPRFIKLASDIITYMPKYVVERLRQILGKQGIALSKAKVLLIGVTYKKDIKDLRKSPSLDIIEILEKENACVCYHDPLIPYLKFNHTDLKSVDLTVLNLKKFDCVVIATEHSAIDYQSLLKNSRIIFDTRNVYEGIKSNKVIKL
ncbi:MAG: nucleotide sugar dehydrogenase [Candidatus Omnitrophica bacterium]|nr:nucleotide sugar dehydrogenase [Candidatus Omnitrophota bacterium]MDD5591999.1 nucleotide sugar dehydrogenase [Candidatus Omnitrophota bacterium]